MEVIHVTTDMRCVIVWSYKNKKMARFIKQKKYTYHSIHEACDHIDLQYISHFNKYTVIFMIKQVFIKLDVEGACVVSENKGYTMSIITSILVSKATTSLRKTQS